MRSRNPVFARAEGFNGRNAHGNVTMPAGGQYGGGQYGGAQYGGYGNQGAGPYGNQQYGSPAGWGVGTPGDRYGSSGASQDRMTVDSAVQKTGISLLVVLVAAVMTWVATGDVGTQRGASLLYALTLIGSLGAFVLSMVNSFKRVVSPPLVLAFAALEGVMVGGFSKVIGVLTGTEALTGVIVGAVVGTVAAVAGTLAAYKFFHIQVGNKFRKFVLGAMIGFVALSLLDMILGFFGSSFGFNGFGTLGLIASVAGLGIGVLMLIMDFDFVERGVAAGLPERESWRAAFGLTVTIVWIYIEMLRILAIIANESR